MSMMIAAALLAQAGQTPSTQTPTPPRGDVVVQGKRLDAEALKQTIVTGFSAPGYRPDITHREYEMAERAAKCATRGRIFGPALVREVVDGVFNSSEHDRWQDRLFRQTASCGMGAAVKYEGGALASGSPVGFLSISRVTPISEASTSDRGVLLRGAVTAEALRRYVPDLQLTREVLQHPVVVHRFVDREEKRAKLRIASDMRYFKVATCLVQRQPETAIRIVYERPLPDGLQMTIAQMIENDRQCVGGAKTVAFDPTQFRLYLGDALYRWAVAAKGVESLVPQGD
ncbi:hypothetical protein JW805_11950 [Roseomonas aeriglobus]|nr:hypothetical protein [Roseomonas aeriglobus]